MSFRWEQKRKLRRFDSHCKLSDKCYGQPVKMPENSAFAQPAKLHGLPPQLRSVLHCSFHLYLSQGGGCAVSSSWRGFSLSDFYQPGTPEMLLRPTGIAGNVWRYAGSGLDLAVESGGGYATGIVECGLPNLPKAQAARHGPDSSPQSPHSRHRRRAD